MIYLTDRKRHLICLPYSIENLHEMARDLSIKKCWFHRDHYDIPKRRIREIEAKCQIVTTSEIVRIIHSIPQGEREETMKKFKDFLEESSLSRIWRKTQNHICGAITGYRDENLKEVNQKNNKEIVAYLQSRGYSLTKVMGNYIENFGTEKAKEVGEPSFFVCNHKVEGDDGGRLEKDLRKLGERFDQDSVLVIPQGGENAYLVGTSKREESYPPYGKKEVVGSSKYGKVAGQFLSRVKGRQFAFEDVSLPQTVNGKRGHDILLKEMLKEMEMES